MTSIRDLLFSIRHPFDRRAIKARILEAAKRDEAPAVTTPELRKLHV